MAQIDPKQSSKPSGGDKPVICARLRAGQITYKSLHWPLVQ
jgi:hypothetical protein